MRLSESSRSVIRQTVREIFGPDVQVRLFGSRVDDDALGGDIDLLITSDTPIADAEQKSLRLVARLQLRLGDQPIDVLVMDPGTARQPIHQQALQQAVPI